MNMKRILYHLVICFGFYGGHPLFSMLPEIYLKVGKTTIKVNPELYSSSSFLEHILEVYEVSQERMILLSHYLAATWKKGVFSAEKAESLINPILDLDKLIQVPGVKLEESALRKLMILWEKAFRNEKIEVDTVLSNLPIEQWVSIAYIVAFLQIELLYPGLRETIINQLNTHIRSPFIKESLFNLGLWNDPLFNNKLYSSLYRNSKCLILNISKNPSFTLSEQMSDSIAITPDGTKVVLVSSDHEIKICDVNTGMLLQKLMGDTKLIYSIAITPDGSKIVTGSTMGSIEIWDMDTGSRLETFANHLGLITSIAITPDASKIVTGSSVGNARIWDMNTGTLLHTLVGHTPWVNSVAITSDGSKVVTGSSDNTAKIWDMNTGALLHTLVGHTKGVTSVAITSDGSKVVTGSSDNTAKIWDVNTGALFHTLVSHTKDVTSVAITPEGLKVVTGSSDGTAKIWDVMTGELLYTLAVGNQGLIVLTLPDLRLVTGSYGDAVKIWGKAIDLSVLDSKQLIILTLLIQLTQKEQAGNLPGWLLQGRNALPDDIKAWFVPEKKWYKPITWFR